MLSTKTIDLPLNPTWMRQPNESERMHAAFMAYASSEKYIKAEVIAKNFGFTASIPIRNRWTERADEFWSDTSRILGQSVETVIKRLELSALIAAERLMTVREVTETHRVSKVSPDGVSEEVGSRVKSIEPDGRVVLAFIERMLKTENSADNTDISGLLETMVRASTPRDEPPPTVGLVEESTSTQRGDGGTAEL